MKPSCRVSLTTTLVGIVVVTVAALGYNTYRNARFTADDLSRQVFEQTALRVDHQINDLLLNARQQTALNQRLLKARQFDGQAFPALAAYWLEVMRVHPKLTRLSLGLESTGEWSYVRRWPDGRLGVGDLRRDLQTGKLMHRDYWPEGFPHGDPFSSRPAGPRDDPRVRPWYVAAKKAGRLTWSETYILRATEGFVQVPGVSCCTPVHHGDGSLEGVLAASFDLNELCRFLKELQVSSASGCVFVVEFRADGSRRVIAHPEPAILLREARAGDHRHELVPIDELGDRRVPAFLASCALPVGFRPGNVQGVRRVRFSHDGVDYLGGYQCLSTRDTPDWLICTLIPEGEVMERVHRSNRETALIGLVVLAGAVLVSLNVSRR